MTTAVDGGYDDGYGLVPCFWGTEPASLIRYILDEYPASAFRRVLDLGCGEGKNSTPFAMAGCRSVAVDCSEYAIANGRKMFANAPIDWIKSNAVEFSIEPTSFDLIIAYGLFHCLKNQSEIQLLVQKMKEGTEQGGMNVVCTFNNRSHDLRAHPGFHPTLLSHNWYIDLYSDWEIIKAFDADLYETHPHNGIAHYHSLTRIVARRPSGP